MGPLNLWLWKTILYHYKNLPVQYTETFSSVKIENFVRIIYIFLLKHRSCVHVRTTLLRQF